MGQLQLGLEIKAAKLPEQLAATLQDLYKKGYRYVAQEEGLHMVVCYSLEPRKYHNPDGGFWGYHNPDAPGVLPAYPITDVEVPGVRWGNKSATLIEVYLGVNE